MPRPTELLIVRQKYTAFGGAERFIARALNELCDRGVRVRVLCREWHPDSRYEVETLRSGGMTRTARLRRFNRLACLSVAANPHALVQSHERIPCCDLYRAGDGVHREWLRQRARLRGSASRWSDWLSPFHRQMLKMERRMFGSRRLRVIVCNSEMVRDEIKHWYGVDDDRLRVIHNGVDGTRFHPSLRETHRGPVRDSLAIGDNATVFLFVGSGYERKGLRATLKAFSGVEGENHLLVVGKDSRMARYQHLARQLGVQARVHFLGPRQDVLPYYGAADAFVLPTLYDPFPNAAVEAMAAGLPVITSTKSGVTDVLVTGDNGLICDALDTEALSVHMQALTDPALRSRIGQGGRKAAEGLSLDHMTAGYRALYRDVFGLD